MTMNEVVRGKQREWPMHVCEAVVRFPIKEVYPIDGGRTNNENLALLRFY